MRTLRTLHRWLGLPVVALLVVLAASGVWIQYEPNDLDAVHPGRMADAEVLDAFRARLANLHAGHPGYAVRGYGMNISGEHPFVSFTLQDASGADAGSLAWSLRDDRPIVAGNPLHGWLLRLHNSLFLGTAGRLACVAAGLALVYFALSGLWFYLALLRQRWRQGYRAPFWPSFRQAPPGNRLAAWMRDLHRWLTPPACLLLAAIAATGLLMQSGPTALRWWSDSPMAPGPPPLAAARPGAALGYSDSQLTGLLQGSLERARRDDRDPGRLFMIDLDGSGAAARLALTYESWERGMYSRLFHAGTGEEYPQPAGVFFTLLRLHRGDYFHRPGTWVDIGTGIALLLLAASGLATWLALLAARRRMGRRAWFWR